MSFFLFFFFLLFFHRYGIFLKLHKRERLIIVYIIYKEKNVQSIDHQKILRTIYTTKRNMCNLRNIYMIEISSKGDAINCMEKAKSKR